MSKIRNLRLCWIVWVVVVLLFCLVLLLLLLPPGESATGRHKGKLEQVLPATTRVIWSNIIILTHLDSWESKICVTSPSRTSAWTSSLLPVQDKTQLYTHNSFHINNSIGVLCKNIRSKGKQKQIKSTSWRGHIKKLTEVGVLSGSCISPVELHPFMGEPI